MRKNSLLLIFFSLFLASCVVSKKKYDALANELTQLKADLKDDDKDGVPNYLDLEKNTDTLAKVDAHGRTERIVKIVDMDEDGILDVNDFCPTIKGIAVANGCPDRDGDGLYDFLDKCKLIAGLKEDEGCPKIKEVGCKLPHGVRLLQFEQNKTNFSKKTKEYLESELNLIAKVMKENPNYILTIFGHTCKMKDTLKSNEISLKRADLVKEMLIRKGVSKQQLITEARGNREPVCPENEDESRKYDDRITFIIKFNEE